MWGLSYLRNILINASVKFETTRIRQKYVTQNLGKKVKYALYIFFSCFLLLAALVLFKKKPISSVPENSFLKQVS